LRDGFVAIEIRFCREDEKSDKAMVGSDMYNEARERLDAQPVWSNQGGGLSWLQNL